MFLSAVVQLKTYSYPIDYLHLYNSVAGDQVETGGWLLRAGYRLLALADKTETNQQSQDAI